MTEQGAQHPPVLLLAAFLVGRTAEQLDGEEQAPAPYNLYDNWLNSALDSGSAATGDYERLDSPAMDSDLSKLAGASTVAEQTADLVPIEKYVADNLPVIPVTTASEWFEYDSDHFVGWPTKADPYETGQPSGTDNSAGSGTDEVVILHLSPRG